MTCNPSTPSHSSSLTDVQTMCPILAYLWHVPKGPNAAETFVALLAVAMLLVGGGTILKAAFEDRDGFNLLCFVTGAFLAGSGLLGAVAFLGC